MKGLRWKFSPRGAAGGVGVVPLIEMGAFYQNPQAQDPQKFGHLKPLTKVPAHAECGQFRNSAEQRMDMAGKLLQSIAEKRQREVLDNADPDNDMAS